MGYRHQPRRITVTFDGEHDYAGFEAVLRGKTLGEWMNLQGFGTEDESGIGDQLRSMSGSLISWNLEDDNGQPVPATPDAVYQQDQDLMFALATAWFNALAGVVTGPLEQSSTDGPQSLEGSLPMEAQSESLAS